MNSHRYILLLLIVSLTTRICLSLPIAIASEEKLKLTLYYEALCPACEDFVVNYVDNIFDNGLISIVDLKLSPYGNAKINPNGTIVCQHGEWECRLNTIEACSIHAWPAPSDHFPFVYCIEKLNSEGKYTEWETCFEKLDLDPNPVTDCYSRGIGHELELQYADEILALEPPHAYVPWVVVDGQPLYDDYTDFISYICKAYKGSNMPKACLGLTRIITAPTDTIKSFNHVCYLEEDNVKSKSKPKSTLSKIISSTVASWMT
ncbi:hypothetical protein SSX86_013195 [Deinandra increscens subsp. villosa]|uniref:Gamma-interferon-inducible lysosomal thiol reductase n=1 Tax=Deinandra increscens subsp. villosa TaxID=3103831 RepID=A0AAP0D612_9ASTR